MVMMITKLFEEKTIKRSKSYDEPETDDGNESCGIASESK